MSSSSHLLAPSLRKPFSCSDHGIEDHLHPCVSSVDASTLKGSRGRVWVGFASLLSLCGVFIAPFTWPETLSGGPAFLGQWLWVPLVFQVSLGTSHQASCSPTTTASIR